MHYLGLAELFLCLLLLQEPVLISDKRVDVSDFLVAILLLFFKGVFGGFFDNITSPNTIDSLLSFHFGHNLGFGSFVFLFCVDLWGETAFSHFLFFLFNLSFPYFFFLSSYLFVNFSLTFVRVKSNDFFFIFINHKVFFGDHEVCSFFMIKLFDELVISFPKVFSSFNFIMF
jgi:hypothetical protein